MSKPTIADIKLEGVGLILVDYARLTGNAPPCPHCKASNSLADKRKVIEDKSWQSKARKSKGDGQIHTWYMLGKKRLCYACKAKAEEGACTMTSSAEHRCIAKHGLQCIGELHAYT
jgi:hypothetical protein